MSTFGEELKRERELREISLREVSEATKISLRYLEALEANEFGELPGGVFNRGFVRAFSQYIGVDPEAMVTSYLMEEQTRLGASASDTNVMRRTPTFETAPPPGLAGLTPEQLRWGLAAIVAIVVIVGGLLMWSLLATDDDEGTATAEPVGSGALAPGGPSAGRAPAAADRPGAATDGPEAARDVRGADAGNGDPDAEPERARNAGLGPTAPSRPRPTAADDDEPATTDGTTDEAGPAPAPPVPVETASPPAVDRDGIRTRIRIVRATSGRVNCDNTRIEMLAGVRPGTTVEFLCKRFLVVDVADAGAVELGLGDRPPTALGAQGERLSGHRIDLTRLQPRGDGS